MEARGASYLTSASSSTAQAGDTEHVRSIGGSTDDGGAGHLIPQFGGHLVICYVASLTSIDTADMTEAHGTSASMGSLAPVTFCVQLEAALILGQPLWHEAPTADASAPSKPKEQSASGICNIHPDIHGQQ